LGDVKANVAAIRATNLDTIVGNINFAAGPVPNVTKTPLVGGQWQDNGNGLELVITNNKAAPGIPLGGETFLLG
jgi:branched-chain amino acid transport system substrate-binding protein